MRKPHRRKDNYKRDSGGEVEVDDTEEAKSGWTKFSTDYMVMDDDSEDKADATLVMVNHEDGGVFAYAVPNKGILGESQWITRRMSKDIDNCGNSNSKLQIKSDQEPSIVVVQEEIRRLRTGRTICTNSPVGESECNGRAENAVKRVENKFRTIKANL